MGRSESVWGECGMTGRRTRRVAHRLGRYRAGRRMDDATTRPRRIAADVGRAVNDRPVETDGAARAAPSSPNSSERLASEADLSLGRTSLVL